MTSSRLLTGRHGETVCVDGDGHRWLVLDPVQVGLTPHQGVNQPRKSKPWRRGTRR
jgi:hypothetical protein